MPEPLDGLVIFSTQLYGFDKDEVGEHLVKVHQKYEELLQENRLLQKKLDMIDKENSEIELVR